MKLKSFECPDTGLIYEFVELAEAYIAKNEENEVFVMSEDEVQKMLDEGQITFDENDILAESDDKEKKDKKDKSDDEDLDGDDDEDKDGTSDDEDVDESKDKKDESDDEDEDVDEESDDEDEKMESLELDFNVTLSEDDQKALFNNDLINEEFAETAKTIFESAVKEKVEGLTEQVVQHYENQLIERIKKVEESLNNDINDYLGYVVSEWLSDNEIAIDSSLKTEMNEKFIEGLAAVYQEHFIKVPDERYDLLEALATKVETLEEDLNTQLETNTQQLKEKKNLEVELAKVQLAEGLSVSQTEKFNSLLENVSHDDLEEFKTKALSLKESYFKVGAGPASKKDDIEVDDDFISVNESDKTPDYITAASRI